MKTRLHKKNETELSKKGFGIYYWEDWDYDLLKYVQIRQRQGRSKQTYADVIIMADTETSRKTLTPRKESDHHNHVCAWSIAFRAYHRNICVLWGKKPSDFPKMLRKVRERLPADDVIVFWHNLPYDWVFLRKFMIKEFKEPKSQLNVKSLYPLQIKFEAGISFRDSLMLAQRSLEKWGNDLCVEHAKAVGKWDYDKIRNQDDWDPDEDELQYMSCDVLCGVECIDATIQSLNKTLGSLPVTATGVVRGEARAAGKECNAWEWATGILPLDYADVQIQEQVFHGGYTHGNRNTNCLVWPNRLERVSPTSKCKDFASSYPFIMCSEKMPAERFWRPKPRKWSKDYVLQNMDDFAFIFKIKCKDVKLKDPRFPMPAISFSKCIMSVNALEDNGRILKADYLETYVNEIDFQLINSLYDFECEIEDLQCAVKDYLPKWLTDYVYKRFQLKTQLKGVDPVLYQIEKAKLNSIFGMSAQKCVKEEIMEDYASGEYTVKEDFDHVKAYERYLKNRNTFLPYCIGIWVTSAAQRNLFRLGSCVPDSELWLYSDTDSVYATGFDEEKVEAYNKECKEKLLSRGYGAVLFKDREYWLGVAEDDGEYTQFTALHAKCYCNRKLTGRGEGFVMADPLKITVAGVPKKGAKSLENKIENFREGFLFEGTISGKLQHTHYFIDKIYVDKNGNETGDSIELSPCDYVIKGSTDADFDLLLEEEVEMIDYENADDE